MLVKTLSGKLHFTDEDNKTLCGLGIRESWATDDTLVFEAENFCERCLELFEEDDFGLEEMEEDLEDEPEDKPARGFKI